MYHVIFFFLDLEIFFYFLMYRYLHFAKIPYWIQVSKIAYNTVLKSVIYTDKNHLCLTGRLTHSERLEMWMEYSINTLKLH